MLECEVKWALGSITTNKASGGDGIPVALFQILKDDAVKVLRSKCLQIWKTQQWPKDWKRSVLIPKGGALEDLFSSFLSYPLHALTKWWRRKAEPTHEPRKNYTKKIFMTKIIMMA